jgi:hypothetical protein
VGRTLLSAAFGLFLILIARTTIGEDEATKITLALQ